MKVKVLHIISSLGEGGAQKILKEVCLSNKELSHSVICFKTGRYQEILNSKKIKVYFLDIKKKPIGSLYKLFIILNFGLKPNIIQTWMYHADLLGSFIKLFWLKKEKHLFWNVRNGTLKKGSSSFLTRRIRNILSVLSFFSPDKIIYCSNNVKIIHESLGYNNKIGEVINNGVNTNYFAWGRKDNIKNNIYKIGFIGRYSAQKNLDLLFKSLFILKKEKINFQLYLVGENLDAKNNKLEKSLLENNLSKEAILVGVKSDIRETLHNLDLLVLPSKSGEGFPNILIEAMSTGLRCISTDMGEAKFIIDRFGWIIKSNDLDSLVFSIKDSINQSYEKRHFFEKKCREHIINHFTLEKMLAKYSILYRT